MARLAETGGNGMMFEAYQDDEYYFSKFTGEEIDALLTCVAEQKI